MSIYIEAIERRRGTKYSYCDFVSANLLLLCGGTFQLPTIGYILLGAYNTLSDVVCTFRVLDILSCQLQVQRRL